LCTGVSSSCEAIAHTIRKIMESDEVEGLLLIDASNAFNSLNRSLALRNILHLCPSLARILINLYRLESNLFIGSDTLLSREGTTQGDPLVMVMYAIASIPLI
uniref:Reverse transcriptase domain-containing protein n=1 Tax=Amphimedon queenslandica TaxID=400682 RepID=A0A1X7V2A6_AMPQE